MAKVGQPPSIQGDIEEMGETPEIVQGAAKMKSSTPSIVILKEESGSCRRKSGTVASVIFERPSVEMDGIPINRLLVDNASATNLISLSMMNKLGKTEKDLIASIASITDFAGGVTNSQGILIMNLKDFWEGRILVCNEFRSLEIFIVVEQKLQEVKNECKVTLFTKGGENYARETIGSGVLSFDREDEEIESP
ncbi:hypothetical protein Acr_28g0008270 [Actinidia rufa]|uniref:Uncharacterized protein n=1 Tax=Actinidia rufa TaxID=165716 RepID=A0A7J0HAI1_9ERIC|nr:hypothetical protein Acr_28g0008270 [Actinidia rufa]